MTKGSGSARLRRARFALSSLPQRSSGLFPDLICRAGKTPDYRDSNTSPLAHSYTVSPKKSITVARNPAGQDSTLPRTQTALACS